MKLVRDKIPDIIRDAGSKPVVERILTNREMAVWLKAKMDEESQEFLQTPCVEEAADIFEVLLGMIGLYNIDIEKVISVAEKKRKAPGGFHKGILLTSVTTENR